jgi:uncharacterized damage-inducible protein DinB
MTMAERMLPEFDEEFALTRKFLALVPDDKLTWKPHEKSMELGRLAWHLSEFPEWTVLTFSKDRYAMTPEQGDKAMNGWKGMARHDMLARFDGDLPLARAVLADASDEEMAQRWRMEWAGQTVIDEPREVVYRKYAIRHMVHHRAQFGLYLRMLRIPIPGCYGPSADEILEESAAAA